jgi:hypothetical protein
MSAFLLEDLVGSCAFDDFIFCILQSIGMLVKGYGVECFFLWPQSCWVFYFEFLRQDFRCLCLPTVQKSIFDNCTIKMQSLMVFKDTDVIAHYILQLLNNQIICCIITYVPRGSFDELMDA